MNVGSEVCDDGNNIADGCDQFCTGPAPGYYCSGGDLNNPWVCIELCGDGNRTISETCEDGNT